MDSSEGAVMNPDDLFRRYQELQQYIGWQQDDARRITAVADPLEPFLPALIDDFYAQIEMHPGARKVITGGAAQIARLKGTLRGWFYELLHGPYDRNPTPEKKADHLRRIKRHIVLGNLIRNAREAMPQGGQLTITGRVVAEGVEVAVADTGHGIPPEHLGRIMEPLYSTKACSLGLGLALARAILDKNKGSLRVASTPGQGSTFIVRLNAVPAAETAS